MIGRLIWYDRDRDIGNDLQNEWRLWIMNLEFWILDGIQNLRTPAADVLMPFITSLWKRRCDMDCTYSYFAPDPENAKNRSDPGSSIDPGRNILQSVSEKSGEKDPSLRYQ